MFFSGGVDYHNRTPPESPKTGNPPSGFLQVEISMLLNSTYVPTFWKSYLFLSVNYNDTVKKKNQTYSTASDRTMWSSVYVRESFSFDTQKLAQIINARQLTHILEVNTYCD